MRRLVFDQSSPVQPVSESRGGTLSVTEEDGGGRRRRTKEILVSNIGLFRLSPRINDMKRQRYAMRTLWIAEVVDQ